ncbi:MAG: NAD(+) synthase [Bacteroidota bacterium]|nr:NAD(+) synthase [Bacteroidota bacterium]
MEFSNVETHITNWLSNYLDSSTLKGFVVGVSGGVDSAVTSTLCAKTKKQTLVINMPILQNAQQFDRSIEHINWLEKKFENVRGIEVDLTPVFDAYRTTLPNQFQDDLSLANLRSRIRMATLFQFASNQKLLVAGTGNKVEDFGVGFYTKYGDGGVDISPIADLMKTEVFGLAKHLGIIESIQNAPPTDGLWDDDRSDEDQLGASYSELEWAMQYLEQKNSQKLTPRQSEVLAIYNTFHSANKHKMLPIPVCEIPENLR